MQANACTTIYGIIRQVIDWPWTIVPETTSGEAVCQAPIAIAGDSSMHVHHQWLLVAAIFTLLLPSLVQSQDMLWQQKYNAGKTALEAQQYSAAEKSLSEAMNIATSFGKDDLRYAQTCNELALVYSGEEKYQDAEKFFLRAFESYKRIKGPDDPLIAMEWNNLGGLYELAGKPDSAEPLFLRALAILEKKYGEASAELVVDLNALADYYNGAQRIDDAMKFAKRSMDISVKTWGDDSSRLIGSLKVLSSGYFIQKKYTDAEPLLRRLLVITQKASATNSEDLLWALEAMSEVCAKQGHYNEAEQTILRALAIRKTSLPAETSNLTSQAAARVGAAYLQYYEKMYNLASFYVKAKDKAHFGDAETDLKAVYQGRQYWLGNNDPRLAEVLNSLGELYLLQNRDADALSCLQNALALRGPNNTQNLEGATSMCSMGALYFKQKDYANAEKMYQEALAIRKKIMDNSAPEIASAMIGLAVLDLIQNKLTDAEPLFKQAIAIMNKAPDLNASNLSICLENYARLLEKTDHHTEAIDCITRARELREKLEKDSKTP